MKPTNQSAFQKRNAALNMSGDTFRTLGHQMIDRIADFLDNIDKYPVAPGESVAEIQSLINEIELPAHGEDAGKILKESADLLFNHSTFNGHPRFLGYITSSAAPIGILAEMLAGSINPNVGGWQLSPMASEIERQCTRWLCTLVGYREGSGGILSSGGNMANFLGFLAAKTIKLGQDVRQQGLQDFPKATVYVSRETHTWIQKAADLFGLGTNQIRWIDTDDGYKMDVDALKNAIEADREAGMNPFLVVGTAGSVSTGVVDDLNALADLCEAEDLWFHVDGAYGAVACIVPDYADQFLGMNRADSIALDPHKWLYSPLEAGCTLVKNANHLPETFSYTPEYYNFDDETQSEINFYEHGVQNSRGFRALKVWVAMRQAGVLGYRKMIDTDCKLAEMLYRQADGHPELEACSCHLSITTFRFVPVNREFDEETLNDLNRQILSVLKKEGQLFISNAVIDGKFYLRSCIVNFRTSEWDIRRVPALVCDVGRRLISE